MPAGVLNHEANRGELQIGRRLLACWGFVYLTWFSGLLWLAVRGLYTSAMLRLLVYPLYHRLLGLYWIDPHNRVFTLPERFEFNFGRAFRKEWIGVDDAVRLARKFVGVCNLGCRAVPNPPTRQTR